ncbi:MAG: CheR family methyltransferase [Planctomycetota bacterium]|jgi:chemotaxis methyl-accepting protein methylase
MKDEQFRDLLQEFGLSWKGYRKVRHGVIKRIRRHMESMGCRSFAYYMNELARSGAARQECGILLCVSISRFFRDRMLWAILEKEVLPTLIEKRKGGVKVWCAGCARGEEVYSFRILWERLGQRFDPMPALELFATDMNADYLEQARAGSYSAGSLKEVSVELRDRCFEYDGDSKIYRVRPDLKKGITWQEQSLQSGPPARDFHMIFLRNNVLTYCLEPERTEIYCEIEDSLASSGWLVIGSHETVPGKNPRLAPHPNCGFLLQKL